MWLAFCGNHLSRKKRQVPLQGKITHTRKSICREAVEVSIPRVCKLVHTVEKAQTPRVTKGSNSPGGKKVGAQFQYQSGRSFCPLSSGLHRWFSGRMLACHAGGPGSIPGRCNDFIMHTCPDIPTFDVIAKAFCRRQMQAVLLCCDSLSIERVRTIGMD